MDLRMDMILLILSILKSINPVLPIFAPLKAKSPSPVHMKTVELILTPQEAFDDALFTEALYQKLKLKNDGSVFIQPTKRSIDAPARARLSCVYNVRS